MENDFVLCRKCGERNPKEETLCGKCAAPLNANIPSFPLQYQKPVHLSHTKPYKRRGTSGVMIALIVIASILGILLLCTVLGVFR